MLPLKGALRILCSHRSSRQNVDNVDCNGVDRVVTTSASNRDAHHMEFILKGDWIRENPHKKDGNVAGTFNLPKCPSPDGSKPTGEPSGGSRGRVPSPCPSNVAVGAKLLAVRDHGDLVEDKAQMETRRPRSSHDSRSSKHSEQHLKREVEKEEKEKQRAENLQKLVYHQGNIITSLKQQLAIVEADLAKEKSAVQEKQNLSPTSSTYSTTTTSSSASENPWSSSTELHIQKTHRAVQSEFPSDSNDETLEQLKQLSEDREALRIDVRELVQEKRFWQEKCRMVLEQMQSLEKNAKALQEEKMLMSKSCCDLSKELEDLKELCAEHKSCTSLRETSLKEIERLTKLANSVSLERKGLQEQLGYLQSRMQDHMDKFSQLKGELQGALQERDAVSFKAEAAINKAEHLEADRNLWKERCNSALAELEQAQLFHEELRKVHVTSQYEVERCQDEVVTLRAALKTQAGDIAKWEHEAIFWQQRAEQLAEVVDHAQERAQAGMTELRQQLESRDRIIQQQKQRLMKMPQIQADLEVLRTELKRAIAAVSDSSESSVEDEGKNSQSSLTVSNDTIPPNLGDKASTTCNCSKKTEVADGWSSTFENPVRMTDSSTLTSEIPVSFAGSCTSALDDTCNSTMTTSEDVHIPAEAEDEFVLSDIFDSNVSLLDLSVEKLSQILQGGGDSRVRHIETQTDLTRECSGKGDAIFGRVKMSLQEDRAAEDAMLVLLEEVTIDDERLNFEAELEDRLKMEKIRLTDSAVVTASVLVEVLQRADEFIRLKETREVEDLELQEVTSERDTLEVLLRKETSARFVVTQRLEDAERKVKSFAEELRRAMDQHEVEFGEKMAEVLWDLEVEKKRSSDLEGNLSELETILHEEKSKSTLLEKEMVKLGRVLAEMTFWSDYLQIALNEKTKKYAKAVQTFKSTSFCLRKELKKQVKRVDKVNNIIETSNKYSGMFLNARLLKRLHCGPVGCRRRLNVRKNSSVLRRRVKQSIWHSVIIQESTEVNSGRILRVAKRKRRRRSFGIVLSELKKNVTRLKSYRDKANGVIDGLETRVTELETENQDLEEEKFSLLQKLSASEERSTVKIRELMEELAAARDVNLQLKHQIQRIFVSLRGDLEAKLIAQKESKLDGCKKGVAPLRNEISRVQDDLEKERSRTVGARKDAAEFNNWFHVLEDYVRNQPTNHCEEDCSEPKDSAIVEMLRHRGGVKSKEGCPPSCSHQDGIGCCVRSAQPIRECQLCFLKTQEVNGSNAGWASRAVHLAHECARRINQQAMTHQANLASLSAAHQRDLAAIRDANAAALVKLQNKQNAEMARIRREVRAELKEALQTEVRANMNAVVERSLAEVEHIHQAEMRKLTRTLSSPMKFRFGRVIAGTGQQVVRCLDLNEQISQPLTPESDRLHARQIAPFSPNPEFGEPLDATDILSRKKDHSNQYDCASPQHFNLGNGVAEEREKLFKLSQELQAEREEASRLLTVLGCQWAALRIRQAYLQAWADVDMDKSRKS